MLALIMHTKIKTFFAILTAITLMAGTLLPVYARSLEEIQSDIDAKSKEISSLSSELSQKQKELNGATAAKNSASSELDKVKAEIDSFEVEIEVLDLEYNQQDQQFQLQTLQKEELEKKQEQQLGALYINWKGNDDIVNVFNSQADNPLKFSYYQEIIAETDQEGLNVTLAKLDDMQAELDALQAKRDEFAKLREEKFAYKKTLEDQLAKYYESIKVASSNVNGIRAQMGASQTQKNELTQEKENLESEIAQGTTGGQQPLISGQLYFSGSVINSPGDPSYDAFGHGIGLSQWGAYGAAVAGWSANQIVTHYYKQIAVETRSNMNISVQGYGTMSVEDYVSGLGEVPDYACGSIDQILNWSSYADSQGWAGNDPRRNKYVIDNPSTVWDCWPEEAIKAQVMTARSYGVTSTQPICITASCQVYKGGKNKAWAAWETQSQYIISKGSTHTNQVIRAFYSSYNSNGIGTADNDTNWPSTNAGGGTAYSYLRSVPDASFTYKPYGRTDFRTNSYSIAELDIMMNWCVSNCNTASWFRDNVRNRVGILQGISSLEDASGRVKKITFSGNSGSATVSGRYFRTLFNKWINSPNSGVGRPSDNLKGITFKINTAQ